jgi:hypothetical protein
MRTTKTALAVALSAVLLAGCGSGGGADSGGRTHGGANGGEDRVSDALAPLGVPAAYDGGKGWDQVLEWVPENGDGEPAATDGETVAYIIRSGEKYAVQARDGATGKVRWTSAPYQVPVVKPESGNIPQLVMVRQGDRTYVTAWAVGTENDPLSTKHVLEIGVYPADASGDAVAPLHELSFPVNRYGGTLEVGDSGAGLLLELGDASAAVDLKSGKVTRYDDPASLVPGCDFSICGLGVAGVTPDGPLLSSVGDGMGTPRGWRSEDVAPEGAGKGRAFTADEDQDGQVTGVHGNTFLAGWGGLDGPLRTAHDLTDGRLLATTECDDWDRAAGVPLPVVTSPSRTYLAQGGVLFDLKAGKGVCLTGADRKSVQIDAVSDDGTAYGRADVFPDDGFPVEVDASTGEAKPLPAGTLPVTAALKGGALFVQRLDGGGVSVSVRLEK